MEGSSRFFRTSQQTRASVVSKIEDKFATFFTDMGEIVQKCRNVGSMGSRCWTGTGMWSSSSHERLIAFNPIVSDEVDRLVAARDTDFRLRCALEYARCDLRRDLSLQRLAMITHVSVWHICRLFRDELGISPARCVKLLRLKRAADLLVNTTLSVKEVMASVGINDASHFARDFRSFTGEVPVEYRARIRKQAIVKASYPQDAKRGQQLPTSAKSSMLS